MDKAGTTAIGVPVDVSDEVQVDAAGQITVKAFGNIDILISNAGIQIVHPIQEFSFGDWKNMLAIHLDGAFWTTRACVKQMIASKKGGSSIYMGSVHSKEASVLKAPYVTVKHGLIGLAKTVAKEGAKHNIRANAYCSKSPHASSCGNSFVVIQDATESRATSDGSTLALDDRARRD